MVAWSVELAADLTSFVRVLPSPTKPSVDDLVTELSEKGKRLAYPSAGAYESHCMDEKRILLPPRYSKNVWRTSQGID